MIISTAKSRKVSKLREENLSWNQIKNRLSGTRRTAETMEEYFSFAKEKQDEIKDVGGFVAGKLRDGRRKRGCVEYRSMITLDMDYGDMNVLRQLKEFYDFTYCIYSTHKHTKEKPRLRLIIPLSRVVSCDEYMAVSRKIAEKIGIEQFDDTTYEPARLMYYPSTSKDGEFVFQYEDREFLNPDLVLEEYDSWQDCNQWPVSSRQKAVDERMVSRQADPLEKEGIVGIFCRTYSVSDAVARFLSNVYSLSLIDNRFDYIPADSTAGLVVYEDKFAYSHHATDPVCGRLCNAFDLVRLHRFGTLDEGCTDKTPIIKRPSFKAMENLCVNDERVKKRVMEEKIGQAVLDFKKEDGEEGEEQEEVDSSWMDELYIDNKGKLMEKLSNIVLIAQNDKNLKGIAYNQHRYGIDVKEGYDLPWLRVKSGWSDTDIESLKVYYDKIYSLWSPAKIKAAYTAVASERAYHPIKDYFSELPKWDGVKRVDTLLVDYLGAEDNIYTRQVTRKTLIAAIARIYEPGKKFDTILVLNGPQDKGKSTIFRKLGLKWFSDSLTVTDMRDKTAAEKLQGYWIVEMGELAGLRKVDIDTIKGFITRTDDKYRESYGVAVEDHPRQCIIVGTTNNEGGFLRDITGNRRYWPVNVTGDTKKKPWDLEEECIDQLWAEAKVYYDEGEDIYLKDEVAEMATIEQERAMETDDREGIIKEYLGTLLPENWDRMNLYERRSFLAGDFENVVGTVQRRYVCPMEIWCECFGKDKGSIKKRDSTEINAMMIKIEGWRDYEGNKNGNRRFKIYNSQRAYERICDEEEI